MKQLSLLAWKEWHEIRAFFWIAIGIFIGLPVIGGIEEFAQHGHFVLLASPWVFGCGAVLAVFVAVGAACRDFHSHLEDFWRSRPVSVTRWLLVKYAVGLGVVLLVCALPLVLEIVIDHDLSVVQLLSVVPFLWIAVFSISFLAGCLVRRPAHAAMLALAAMLLVYCLPTVLPPLAWLDIWSITDSRPDWDWNAAWSWDQLRAIIRVPQLIAFAAGMLAIGGIALMAALIAVRRDWRLESGRKMMYGSVAGAVLILFCSAAYRLGTNMPILQTVDLPDADFTGQFVFRGQHGYLLCSDYPYQPNQQSGNTGLRSNWHSVDLTSSGVQVGPAQPLNSMGWGWGSVWTTHTAENPNIEYQPSSGPATPIPLRSSPNPPSTSPSPPPTTARPGPSTTASSRRPSRKPAPGTDNHYYLMVTQLGRPVKAIQLPWQYDPNQTAHTPPPRVYAWTNRLFFFGTRLLTLDISDPLSPTVISDTPFDYQYFGIVNFGGEEKGTLRLPPFPHVPPLGRLGTVIYPEHGFDGQTLCQTLGGSLIEYRR
ncbi:MAG: hypothetical protein ABSH22_19365, partial [Tepidisphaeraceae bacterium]